MEALAVQCEAKWDVAVPSPLPVPVETMVNIIENLVPTHNLFNPVYVGSKALASAIEMRNKLQTLCRVSQRMNAIAVPYLYQIIVITDSNELTRLHETLMKKSVKQQAGLGGYIESLAVHQNIIPPRYGDGQHMSLDHFCNSLMSIIQRSPRLTKFSLVPIGTEVFIGTEDEEYNYRLFMPRVETLGVTISSATWLIPDKSPEDRIFADLLNLPRLSDGAIQEVVLLEYLAADKRSIIVQRPLPFDRATATLDMRGSDLGIWRRIGAIGLSFSCLSSLPTWYAVQHWSRVNLPAQWGLRMMRSLRHLSINIQVNNAWSDRFLDYRGLWGHPDRPFDLHVLPNLETLRIPLRLFMAPDEISMHNASDVLPVTLETLVLCIDLQVHRLEPPDREVTEWSWDQGDEYSISDPRSCAQTIRLALGFLEDILWCASSGYRNLCTRILEYKKDNFSDRDWLFRDEALEEFTIRLGVLGQEFQRHGIRFSLVAL